MAKTPIGTQLQVYGDVCHSSDTVKFYFRVRIHSGEFGKWYEIDPDTAEMLIQLCGWINEHIEEARKHED